jgi:hypothetical protein
MKRILFGFALLAAAAIFTPSAKAQNFSVVLTWQAPITSPDPIVGYNVYRRTYGSYPSKPLNPAPLTALTYTDTTVVNGTTYAYEVLSVDAQGNQSQPAIVEVVIPCGTASVPCAAASFSATVQTIPTS